jgi:hypothetical protein
MIAVVTGSLGLVLGGWPGAFAGMLAPFAWSVARRRNTADAPITLVLLLLLVALRSGLSVLAAIVEVSSSLPRYRSLARVGRVALVSGLVAALPHADQALRPVVAQLARAQRSGASLSGAVRRLLDQELAAQKAARIARARALPVRLMLPVTLLMLPGLVLFLYAPTLIEMFSDVTGVLG